jgi:hypothetical protein
MLQNDNVVNKGKASQMPIAKISKVFKEKVFFPLHQTLLPKEDP